VCQQGREFIKTYLFSVQQRQLAMWVELTASLLFLAFMVFLHLNAGIGVAGVLLAGAIGASSYFYLWIKIKRELDQQRRRRFRLMRYRVIWRQAKWSLAGAVANEVTTRSYNYLIAWFGGFELLGLINFIRQLFSPIQLLSNAWSQISLPVQRDHYVANRIQDAQRLRAMAQTGFAAVTVAWALILYISAPYLQEMKSELHSPLVPLLLLLWCIYYLIDCQLVLFRIEFHVKKLFRYLFEVEFISAIIIIALSVPMVRWLPETWLVGLAATVNGCVLLSYIRKFRRDERPLIQENLPI
jgi:O-antigen/teichoic acid export membrane protein